MRKCLKPNNSLICNCNSGDLEVIVNKEGMACWNKVALNLKMVKDSNMGRFLDQKVQSDSTYNIGALETLVDKEMM